MSSEVTKLREALRLKDQQLEEAQSKDQQLEESKVRISKLEKDNASSSKMISKLEVDVKFIEQQWEKSAFEIKDNILAQCLVIFPYANFHEIGLDKCIIDSHIEVPPLEEENNDEEPTIPVT